MEKDFSIEESFEDGDWVLSDGRITKLSKSRDRINQAAVRDIVLTPEILCDLGFCRAFGPCPDGTYNFCLESEIGSRFRSNLDKEMIRLEDILYCNATSVRGLQHIIREYGRRYPHNNGEFTFLVRRINKYFSKMAK